MLRLKNGVQPRNLYIAAAMANVAQEHGRTVTITAGSNGVHKVGSKHYTYAALDMRTKDFPDLASKKAFVAALLTRLGPKYQAFLEHVGEENEHLHAEFEGP